MNDRDEKRVDWSADRGATEPRNGTVDTPRTPCTPGECSTRNECSAPTLTDAERTLIEKLTWESEHPKMGRSIWVTPQDRETAHGLLERHGTAKKRQGHIKGTGEQGFHMQADLVHRLRSRSYSFKIPDPLVEEAADEIARLRLTDAEREALHHVVGDVADITGPVEDTLRGLLKRMK